MKPLFYTIAALMSALVVGCTDNVPTQASQPIRTQGITEMNEQENDDEAVEEQVDVKVSKKAAIAIAEMQDDVDKPETFSNTERIRLVSYNCENLYDTEDDPKTNDDEFTPDGVKKWNKAKYKIKRDAFEWLQQYISYKVATKDENFGNARFIRNTFEKVVQNQADRLARQSNISNEELTIITIDDVNKLK